MVYVIGCRIIYCRYVWLGLKEAVFDLMCLHNDLDLGRWNWIPSLQVYRKIDFLNLMRASCHYSLFCGHYSLFCGDIAKVATRKITLRELFFTGTNFCGSQFWDFLRELNFAYFSLKVKRKLELFCELFDLCFSHLKSKNMFPQKLVPLIFQIWYVALFFNSWSNWYIDEM